METRQRPFKVKPHDDDDDDDDDNDDSVRGDRIAPRYESNETTITSRRTVRFSARPSSLRRRTPMVTDGRTDERTMR